jgi:hypothetical protein
MASYPKRFYFHWYGKRSLKSHSVPSLLHSLLTIYSQASKAVTKRMLPDRISATKRPVAGQKEHLKQTLVTYKSFTKLQTSLTSPILFAYLMQLKVESS